MVCAGMEARGGGLTAKLEQYGVEVSVWLCWGTRNTPWISSRAFFSLLLSVFNYLFIFGYPESSLLCGLFSSFEVISGAILWWCVRASHGGGFSTGSRVLGRQ